MKKAEFVVKFLYLKVADVAVVPIAQRIEQQPSKLLVGVRFPLGTQKFLKRNFCVPKQMPLRHLREGIENRSDAAIS